MTLSRNISVSFLKKKLPVHPDSRSAPQSKSTEF